MDRFEEVVVTSLRGIVSTARIPSQVKVLKRSPSKQEAKSLVREIKKTSNITGYTVKEWTNSKNVFVAENGEGEILGACLSVDFSQHWTELAVLFVFEEYRGLGIGRTLFSASYVDILERKKNVLAMSKNQAVVKMMEELDFKILPNLKNLKYPYQQYQFTLTILYNIIWLANLYRIYEIIRKRSVYASKEPYTYGLKLVG